MEANPAPSPNPKPEHIKDLLGQCRVVAVVGLSPDPARDSHRVAAYLQQRGFRIIPVNPKAETILGQKCYPDLASIPEAVDIVDVFRSSEHAPEIARQAVAARAKCLWLQQGVRNEEAAAYARVCGLLVVQDRCLKVDHQMLMGYQV
ncbi:MAG: CoA-binding protein [Desulfarculus sp.]|nr:CoA-binding protein [Desulfarculus sp.]